MRHDGPSSLTDSIGAPLAASDTSGTIRPRHPNAASSHPAKSAATARIRRGDRQPGERRRDLAHGRQVEEVRERRAPSGESCPADVGEHGVLEERRRQGPERPRIVRIEDDPIGQRRHPVESLGPSAAPPDDRRQAGEPDTGNRVVDVFGTEAADGDHIRPIRRKRGAVAVDGDPDEVQRARIFAAAQDVGDVAQAVATDRRPPPWPYGRDPAA